MTAVVTLTPAPVLDRTYMVEDFTQGKVNRATEVFEYMSGKGLNVARTMHLDKRAVVAVLPIGKDDEHLLFRTPYPQILRIVPIEGRVRVNTTVVEGDGCTTNINQRAVPITSADWERVVDLTIEQVAELGAGWLVVSGQHPKIAETGEPIDLTRLFEGVRELGARVGVDTSGPELPRWARSPLVNLIKPNADELANLVGRNLHTIGDALEAGRELCEGGLELALVSLGADGALGITKDEAHWARAVAPEVINTTGAGDSTLAGFLSQATAPDAAVNPATGLPALDIEAGLRVAVSWGALAVSLPTTLISDLSAAPVASFSGAPVLEHALVEPTHLGVS